MTGSDEFDAMIKAITGKSIKEIVKRPDDPRLFREISEHAKEEMRPGEVPDERGK